ncbi:MAG: hypothetical protein HY324_02785, partial [Chlamydiia bacterium]|nr:hypothetical protein [Chlamydiia bacterium]
MKNPADERAWTEAKETLKRDSVRIHEDPLLASFPSHLTWGAELTYLTPIHQLNLLLDYKYWRAQHERLTTVAELYATKLGRQMPTRWQVWERNALTQAEALQTTLQALHPTYLKAQEELPKLMEEYRPFSHAFTMAFYLLEHPRSEEERHSSEFHLVDLINKAAPARALLAEARTVILLYQKKAAELETLLMQKHWVEESVQGVHVLIPPWLRTTHWEEDAGGSQELNQYLPWWELTRINRKDLVASLLFGIRISMVVGILAVALSLIIGLPLGILAGYFAGKTDLVICRFVEMWEAMP